MQYFCRLGGVLRGEGVVSYNSEIIDGLGGREAEVGPVGMWGIIIKT